MVNKFDTLFMVAVPVMNSPPKNLSTSISSSDVNLE